VSGPAGPVLRGWCWRDWRDTDSVVQPKIRAVIFQLRIERLECREANSKAKIYRVARVACGKIVVKAAVRFRPGLSGCAGRCCDVVRASCSRRVDDTSGNENSTWRGRADSLSWVEALTIPHDVRVPAEEHQFCDVMRRGRVFCRKISTGRAVPGDLAGTRQRYTDRTRELAKRLPAYFYDLACGHLILVREILTESSTGWRSYKLTCAGRGRRNRTCSRR
jgi:hypothetical protein